MPSLLRLQHSQLSQAKVIIPGTRSTVIPKRDGARTQVLNLHGFSLNSKKPLTWVVLKLSGRCAANGCSIASKPPQTVRTGLRHWTPPRTPLEAPVGINFPPPMYALSSSTSSDSKTSSGRASGKSASMIKMTNKFACSLVLNSKQLQ